MWTVIWKSVGNHCYKYSEPVKKKTNNKYETWINETVISKLIKENKISNNNQNTLKKLNFKMNESCDNDWRY